MKAWVLHGVKDLRLEERALPSIAEKEVLVEVKAAGICGSDVPRIYQTGTYSFPLIPGHEFSGIVRQVGSSVDKKWLEKRVGIFPLIPCQNCTPCQRKQYEMCRDYSYLGSRRDGGFAEYTAVPADNLLLLPARVSYESAAMLEPMAVAVHAMRRITLHPFDKVVVWGLGTIGMLLLLFLLEAGQKEILVIGNKEAQKQRVIHMGLPETCYCDARKQETVSWILEHTNGVGANVVLDCVGKQETFSQAVCAAGPGGSVLLVGNPDSDRTLEKEVYWKILRNQLHVTGTWNSSFTHEAEDDWHYVLKRLEEKRILPEHLISHKMSMEELERGLHIMRDKTEEYGKIMGVWN